MPRFNSINFYQNWPKIKLFLPKKYKMFERWELRPQFPVPPVVEGLAPTPQMPPATAGPCTPTPLQISCYAPDQKDAKQICARSRTLIITILNFEIMENILINFIIHPTKIFWICRWQLGGLPSGPLAIRPSCIGLFSTGS